MGKKSIAPRAEPCDDDETDETEGEEEEEEETAPLDKKAKRDLTGFDRALKFSEAALTKGPKVQLGTGAEGSGVGIIVDNNASTSKCFRHSLVTINIRIRVANELSRRTRRRREEEEA